MTITQKSLSVAQAAALCGVGRTTVGYWIRSQKIRADRVGRNYSIPVQDLLYFLKSNGQKIPAELQADNLNRPSFKSFQHCWDYWLGSDLQRNCEACVAFRRRVAVCFTAKNFSGSKCSKECDLCQYYSEIFLPRIHFVNQIDSPAAVVKDLYFWCGNLLWAQLCEVEKKDLIGLGIEEIVHPSSLESMISQAKRKALGDFKTPEKFALNLKNRQSGKIALPVGVYPLTEPEGAFLVLVESAKQLDRFRDE